MNTFIQELILFLSKDTLNCFKVTLKTVKMLSNISVVNFDNKKKCFWAANQDIRIISEGSCGPEDRGKDAENSALAIQENIFKWKTVSLNYSDIS